MNKQTTMIVAAVALAIFSMSMVAAEPVFSASKGGITANDTMDTASADSFTAYGANITTFDIAVQLSTGVWTGIFGNVSSTLVLEGTGGNTFYDWGTQSGTTGTVLFSNSSNVAWDSITTTLAADATEEDTFLALSALPENVTATFSHTNSAEFDLGTTTIAGASSQAANSSSNGGTDWETILLDDGVNAVYATPITTAGNENYAGLNYNFQTLLPVSGSTQSRVYYIYAAVE